MNALPPILTKREAADFLRCTERQIDILRTRGDLPFQRFGGGVRFRREDVEAQLKPSAAASANSIRPGLFGRATSDAAELPPSLLRPVRA